MIKTKVYPFGLQQFSIVVGHAVPNIPGTIQIFSDIDAVYSLVVVMRVLDRSKKTTTSSGLSAAVQFYKFIKFLALGEGYKQ